MSHERSYTLTCNRGAGTTWHSAGLGVSSVSYRTGPSGSESGASPGTNCCIWKPNA